MKNVFFVIALILILPMLALSQQKDSLIVKDTTGKIEASSKVMKARGWRDSTGKRTFSPRKAAIYSAVLPGLGQIYNKKYWKVPIVYAAIGIPVYTFFDNKTWYNRTRYALKVAEMDHTTQEYTDALADVHSSLLPLVDGTKTNSLLNYRNEFRKNMDYSILFTLLFWGLNVVDATVDAHLKGFNVSDNLAMQVRPAILPNQAIGVSILFKFADNRSKAIP
ncbi:hypothetical protein FAM09_22600 [Niastella caeni]|uniref:DUF5683 domain-containing protein n=1 Tax=Niastella caeni TaxID=2569763 RepID=A0A4S8HJK9_9BACT|nr:DUF5683 domain-containing protein [Niastella caeni]THU34791.1 hypothetical protein FAM09_22600 [Niastella caeni]